MTCESAKLYLTTVTTLFHSIPRSQNEAVLEGGDIENEDLHDGSDVNGEDEDEDDSFYNKTRSFFDNISCEATERLKGG